MHALKMMQSMHETQQKTMLMVQDMATATLSTQTRPQLLGSSVPLALADKPRQDPAPSAQAEDMHVQSLKTTEDDKHAQGSASETHDNNTPRKGIGAMTKDILDVISDKCDRRQLRKRPASSMATTSAMPTTTSMAKPGKPAHIGESKIYYDSKGSRFRVYLRRGDMIGKTVKFNESANSKREAWQRVLELVGESA